MPEDKIEVENINTPGRITRVDAAKYHAMRVALLKALPKVDPGLTQAQMRDAVLPYLSQEHFPGGEKRGWWAKCVQLDLEAKNIIVRDGGKPLRWRQI